MLGSIKNVEIKENKDGGQDVVLLQVEISDPEDLQTVEAFRGIGEDFSSPVDSRVIYIAIGNAYKIAVALDDGVAPDPTIEEGERELYSSDGGERKAKHRFKKDGTHVLNDGEDFAVRFSKLESAYNDLQDKWNQFANAYKPGGGGQSPLGAPVSASPSNADIGEAKVEDILLP